MVGAPELIWAFQSDGGQRGWLHTQPPQAIIDIPTAYVRADLFDALTEERDRLKEIVDGTGLAAAAIAAERDRLAKANAELKPLLQNIGDGIANMFDQLVKGNWRDDHDHDVKMNVHMLNLHDVLKQIMRFRADYLDYSEPDFTKHKATSTEREGE